jgi:hypothetical protein
MLIKRKSFLIVIVLVLFGLTRGAVISNELDLNGLFITEPDSNQSDSNNDATSVDSNSSISI